MVDEIAQLLGLPLLPSHTDASSSDAALHGVNYASAAAGILDNTGQNFVGRIPFNQQIKNFERTLDLLSRKLDGASRLAPSLARSIFYVGMGSNDYLNNYLMPNYNTRNEYNGDQYSTLLVQQYAKQLSTLYNLGARRFVIAGVGSMACIPNMRARSPVNMCSPDVDDLIIPFNNKVKANRPGAKFIYVDIYAMISQVLRNPWSYGFSLTDRGCCGIGRNRGMITCPPFLRPCPVPQPERLHLLGRLPPNGAGECAARQGRLQRRQRRCLPDEHPAARSMAAVDVSTASCQAVDLCVILQRQCMGVVYKLDVWS